MKAVTWHGRRDVRVSEVGFATHRLPLSEAPQAYDRFQRKEDGTVKVLFQP